MSLLQAFIDRILGRVNLAPAVMVGVSDDGSADPVAAGKTSPLRVDPTTGELLVKSSSGGGGGGGTVDQGSAGSSSWKVVEDNSASIKTAVEATNGRLPAALGQTTKANSLSVALASNQDALPITDNGGSLTVDGSVSISGSVTETNSASISTNTGRIPSQGQALAGASLPVVLPLSQAAGALALQSQFPAALGAGGGIKIDGSGTALPVSGTFWQTTQPVSVASLPLPSGAATSALQGAGLPAAFGAGGGVKIDGSGTALPVSISGTITVDTEASGAATPTNAFVAPSAGSLYVLGMCYRSDTDRWNRLVGNESGLYIQGNTTVGSGLNHNPVAMGACNSTTVTRVQSDSTGRLTIVGGAASGVAATENPVLIAGSDGTNKRTVATTFGGSQIVAFDSANVGPFGDLIAEGKTPVLSRYWALLNAFDPQQDETVTAANGATVTVNAQRLTLTSGMENAADAVYRTVKTAQYRPGQGFIFRWTAAFTTNAANSTQEIGFGNGASGGGGNAIAVGYNGTSFGILYRNAGSSTWIAQASWNGDKLNGTGTSGVTINPAFGNVFFAHVPYLGYGPIRIFCQLSTGEIVRIHTIQYPNSSASVEFSDPAFRFYGRVVSTGSTTNLVAYAGSAAAYTIGKVGNNGQQFAESRTLSVNGTAAIFSIRCATTVNGALNNTPIRIRSVSFTGDNGNTTSIGIVSIGATLGGTPAFSALTGQTATTADNGVTLTNATTIGTIDIAGTTVTGGNPIFNTATSRNNVASSGELEENPLFIWPGQTMTFYATTGAATNVTFAVNGTIG